MRAWRWIPVVLVFTLHLAGCGEKENLGAPEPEQLDLALDSTSTPITRGSTPGSRRATSSEPDWK